MNIRYIAASYFTAIENVARFRVLTGMPVKTIDSFLPYFASCYHEYFWWHTVEGWKLTSGRIPCRNSSRSSST
ncbi:MAG: hypothetical protein K2L00_00100 [Muribaculaceae bacterium]|nr:hypothetical protein [Muribaculaceae bacterium]